MTPRFNPRVNAVAIRDGRVLMSRATRDAFWCLPGGRIEPGEPSEAALAREMAEELGLATRVGRLVFVVENFFAYGGRRFHEFGLYFTVDLPAGAEEHPGEFAGAEPDLVFRWFPLAELPDLDVRPAFLRERLADLPRHPLHVQWPDGRSGAGPPD